MTAQDDRRLLLDASGEILLLLDAATLVIVDANAGTTALLGWPREALLGQPIGEFECAFSDMFFWDDMAARESAEGVESALRCADGGARCRQDGATGGGADAALYAARGSGGRRQPHRSRTGENGFAPARHARGNGRRHPGERVVGLQFHREMAQAGARQLIAHCSDDLVGGRYIQKPREMLADAVRFDAVNGVMDGLLDRFTAEESNQAVQEDGASRPTAPTRAGESPPNGPAG